MKQVARLLRDKGRSVVIAPPPYSAFAEWRKGSDNARQDATRLFRGSGLGRPAAGRADLLRASGSGGRRDPHAHGRVTMDEAL